MSKNEKNILIIEESLESAAPLEKRLKEKGYRVFVCLTGEEGKRLIYKENIHLLYLRLILPKIHGISILKEVKQNPKTKNIGVIICTHKALPQNHQSAIECGADFFLVKPYNLEFAVELAQTFFSGKLQPYSFEDSLTSSKQKKGAPFTPILNPLNNYIRFWGTRGSIPVSGINYQYYGGNTPCLEMRQNNNIIIIDAGTGIRPLGNDILTTGIKNLHIFIGHTHWDHIIGFPFFSPVYDPSYTIHIYAAHGFEKSIKDIFTGMLEHDYFPVRLDEMQAKFIFHDLTDDKAIEIGDVKIHYNYAIHPGVALCFKVTYNKRTIGYATDNEMFMNYHGHPNDLNEKHQLFKSYKSIIDFFSDCDLLIHEAQYTPKDYLQKIGWGHSSITNALALIKLANIKEWIVTHHDPEDTDDVLRKKLHLHRKIIRKCEVDCSVHMAFDGLTLPL